MKLPPNIAPHKRRILTATSILLSLIILLISTPYVIQIQITKLLKEFGAQEAYVEDVNFNPFYGVIEVSDLKFSSSTAKNQHIKKLSTNVRLLSLFSKRIHLQDLAINGINFTIETDKSGEATFGGLIIPEAENSPKEDSQKSSPWGFGIDSLLLTHINIDYRSPKLTGQLELEHLQLVELANWDSNRESPFKLKAKLNNDPIIIEGEMLPFAKDPTFSGKAILKQIELKPFSLLVSQIENLSGQLSINSSIKVTQHADSSIELTHDGKVQLDQLKLKVPDAEIVQEQLQWQGKLHLAIKDGDTHPSTDSVITLKGIAITVKEKPLVAIDTLSTAIKFDDLQQIALAESSIGNIVIGKNLYKPDEKGGLAENLLSTQKIIIPNIEITDRQQLAIDKIALSGMTSTLRRNNAKIWIPISLMPISPTREDGTEELAESPASTAPPEENSKPISIQIGEITLDGENHILFDDQGVAPPYRADLSIKELAIKQINSSLPKQASPVFIQATIDKYGKLDIEGSVQPFAEKPVLALNSTIKAIPLSSLSSYTIPMMGYVLTSGQLDSTAKITMDKGKIGGEIGLTLNGLEVESASAKEMKKVDQKSIESQMNIPLGTALNMLRDSNRTITLNIPISGSSDNPNIDPSDVINTAIAKAMKKGALSYLISSLQPYGSLISLAKVVGESAMKVRLEPIKFSASSTEVNHETKAYLAKVVKLMGDRPELNIKVCGVAVEADHQALLAKAIASAKRKALKKKVVKGAPATKPIVPTISDEQLLALAKKRATAAKDILIGELKADTTHLIDCKPS
ncbi:MAG: DUF748 domain-containing protein, partial [Chromatiales bacterium]|nr:DUF748 domain-containing protein [Chromatiales bacterium]